MAAAASVLRTGLLLAALSCSDPSPELSAVRPLRRDIEQALITNGRIEATGRVAVHAETAGSVDQVFVQPGDTVKKGQRLLQFADTGQREARKQRAARLDAAKARLAALEAGLGPVRRADLESERSKLSAALDNAARDLEKLDRLVSENAATRAEQEAQRRVLDGLTLDLEAIDLQLSARPSESQRRELEALVRDAEAALRLADRKAARLSIRAPAAGVAYSLPVIEGEFLATGGLVARIGSLESVRARVFVDEPDLGLVQVGAVARITADAYPGRGWDCAVDRLAAEIVEMGPRRVGEISCRASDPSGRLLPNLAVGVRIVTDSARQALSLPRSAVLRSAGQAHVWTVSEGRASRRPVDPGVEGPVYVEIRKGVGPSDTVLIPGDEPISEGQRVSVRTTGGFDG